METVTSDWAKRVIMNTRQRFYALHDLNMDILCFVTYPCRVWCLLDKVWKFHIWVYMRMNWNCSPFMCSLVLHLLVKLKGIVSSRGTIPNIDFPLKYSQDEMIRMRIGSYQIIRINEICMCTNTTKGRIMHDTMVFLFSVISGWLRHTKYKYKLGPVA